jgi:hypothetical protein
MGLGLLGPESVYLIDPRELKPVGFVSCPPHRKIHVALDHPSEVSNPESEFLTGPPPGWSCIL